MKKTMTLVSAALLSVGMTAVTLPAQAAWPQSVNGQQLPSLAPMVEAVSPAVVSVSVEGTQVARQNIPEPFRHFFGREREQVRPFRGLGSGVIVDADKGHVITNHHVINNADKILVNLNDGREFEAKLIGSDPATDVAVLKIEADDLTAVKVADSDTLRVGDFTVAIGNPFGLGQTVTSGIVSALGRSGLGNGEALENFIQTDAAINSGNSGGALVNLNGELIGINTAIIAPSGGNVGIGFAIPVNMVRALTDQILEFGEVRRGVLGILGGELTSETAKLFGLETTHGAYVSQVFPDSAADAAGLKAGDVIVSVDGKKIKSFQELRAKVATKGAGATVKLGVIRDGDLDTYKVTLNEAPGENVQASVIHPALEGAKLSSYDEDNIKGVIISEVSERSPAAAQGLAEGDIIVAVNLLNQGRSKVRDLGQLRELFQDYQGVFAATIVRDGVTRQVILR
ncbi:DegQ family serine endoprotease [Ferrimonas balearica]|uniref:DegQ family serine endoprotease n=1 Tax=Ferrimonas balearica TaxID=44012 RepID=UPI001C995E73|nr:DegQ family serine endoprotease [Ferrimonas balearica]MBY5993086.1 DegQ family serine endoprotease [Ferrimonas balearica]